MQLEEIYNLISLELIQGKRRLEVGALGNITLVRYWYGSNSKKEKELPIERIFRMREGVKGGNYLMPTQTKLEFYKVFNIPKKRMNDFEVFGIYIEGMLVYPIITYKMLLELLRLGLNYDFVIHSKDLKELEEKLLKLLVYNKTDEIYHAVRKIMGVE